MPTHRIEYTATDVPADLPKDAKVTQVSKYPVILERRASKLELFSIPTNEGTNKARLAAAIKVNGENFELTEETARQLVRELNLLISTRRFEREKAERDARRLAEVESIRVANERINRLMRHYGYPASDPWRFNLMR
jgi:hypothetical protein